MVASLNGIIFDQIYGDNSGGTELDIDGDGTATQEDEFVSFSNTTGAPVDISGWQVWSDSIGAGAPDWAQDGLYHTFPPGTVLSPGETLFVINEITGPTPSWAQEASEGGVESGAGGVSTNFLSEGTTNSAHSESIALVDPATGDFLVFNMNPGASDFSEFDGGGTSSNSALTGFPGSNMVAEIDGASVLDDQNASTSYQYNSGTDSYQSGTPFTPCLGEGTFVQTDQGERAVETLQRGDLIKTVDHGFQPLRAVLSREVVFNDRRDNTDRPVLFAPGSLGPNHPRHALSLSPQHRVLTNLPDGSEVLCPAKGLLHMRGVRYRRGVKRVRYFHLVMSNHELIEANGAVVESFFPGEYSRTHLSPHVLLALLDASVNLNGYTAARPFIGPKSLRRRLVSAKLRRQGALAASHG